jgi:RimJ/RimL family protein N-acetyltransferase
MASTFEARKVRGIRVRPMRPDDAVDLAKSMYESFFAFNQSVKIPPHLDFPSIEAARTMMQHMASAPWMYGVVAEEESSGALMGAGLITPGDAYGIGPVWADNAFKGKGAGKAVMIALIEIAKSENAKSIRLNQIAANVVSFSLYASLGFLAVECWQDLEGCVTEEQSLLASRSVGFQPLTGVHVRKMEDADVEVCNELNVKAIDFGREQEIRIMIRVGNAWVLIRDGEIIAYTLGFDLFGHTVAQTEEALVSLFTGVCLQYPASGPLPTLHLPGRLYPRLLRWALAAKLRVHRNCWLMVIGAYQSPQHGMVYCPGISY